MHDRPGSCIRSFVNARGWDALKKSEDRVPGFSTSWKILSYRFRDRALRERALYASIVATNRLARDAGTRGASPATTKHSISLRIQYWGWSVAIISLKIYCRRNRSEVSRLKHQLVSAVNVSRVPCGACSWVTYRFGVVRERWRPS